MKPMLKAAVILLVLSAIAIGVAVAYVLNTGVSARDQPGRLETFVAGAIRRAAVARRARELRNPVAATSQVLGDARAHYADHCAGCHANDGSGNTEMGRNLFPRAPDMRLALTQNLTDGELFWIIENGIRFTGMPGWSNGTPQGATDSWKLVHFVRRLPALTPDEIHEMESMNPRSPEEIRQEIEEQRFLAGSDAVTPSTHNHGGSK